MCVLETVKPEELKTRADFEKFEESCSKYENPRVKVASVAVQWGHLDLLKYTLDRESRLESKILETLLFHAIKDGNLAIVKYLIESHNVNIDEGCRYRWTAIKKSIINGRLDIVKYFVEEGMEKNIQPDLRHTYHEFRSLLFVAVEYKRDDIITYLTEKGKVYLTWVDEKKENVLFKALRKENLDFIKYVLDEKKVKIDINWRNDESYTLIHLLVINFKSMKSADEILRYLTSEKYADLDRPIPLAKLRMTPLLYAITHLPLTIIKYLIDNGANMDKRNVHGQTALHLALFGEVERGLEICEYLCRHGANVNQEDDNGKTPMAIALKKLSNESRMLNACKLFIEYGVNVNSTDKRGNHFVHIAAIHNNLNFLDYLVSEKQVDVNTPRETDNITPLHWAAFRFHLEICKYLIKHGARVDRKNQRDETPFDMSLKASESLRTENTGEVWKLLLENGANVNWTDEEGNELVHIAVMRRNQRFLDYLVCDKQVDIHTPRETDGWTPLHCAVFQNSVEICRYLIERGARVNQTNQRNETPFDMSLTKLKEKEKFDEENSNTTEICKLLLENGANVNWTDKKGNKLVHFVVLRSNRRLLDYLLFDKQADINTPRETDGWTPLHCAAFQENIEFCSYLLKHGARVNQKDKNGRTPLDTVLMNAEESFWEDEKSITERICILFIKHGASLNSTDKAGNQLVHIAAKKDGTSLLEILFKRKRVDINTTRESDGSTALHCAAYEGNFKNCRYLVKHGARIDQKDKERKTPLDIALKKLYRLHVYGYYSYQQYEIRNVTEICKLFIEYSGMNVNSTDIAGNQLVHNAATYNKRSFLEYLIKDKQVDINTPRKKDNWTPLHCAASGNHYYLCEYLIEHGADIQAKSKCGKTPIEVTSYEPVIHYLKQVLKTRRSRRNVINYFPTFPRNPTYQEFTHKRIAGPVNSYRIRSPDYDSNFHFENFLSYLSLLMRYFVGGSINSSKILQPPLESFANRVDPVAANAVDYFANFIDG